MIDDSSSKKEASPDESDDALSTQHESCDIGG